MISIRYDAYLGHPVADGGTKLPALAIDGETPVRHRERLYMYEVEKYWVKRRDAARELLGTLWEDENHAPLHAVGIQLRYHGVL